MGSFVVTFQSSSYILSCLVPVRRFPAPSWSIQFGDVSEANGWETPHFFARTTWAETHWPRGIMRPRD